MDRVLGSRVEEITINDPKETEQAALVALGSIKDVMETRVKIHQAQLAIAHIVDLAEAKRVLEADHEAVFSSEFDFMLHGMKGRLQGPRGEVGTSKALRAKRKRERQARRKGRCG